MTLEEIKSRYTSLATELYIALETFERKDKVKEIYNEINGLRKICPHQNALGEFSLENGCCTYCGKKL